MTRSLVIRLAVAGTILAVLVHQLGAEPFLRAFDRVSPAALVLASLLVAATTLCSAARWALVARRLGLDLSVRAAVPAYYRSQLLNQVLPGGVLGDVHRAVRHGTEEEALGRAARAVVWERVVGQVGLVTLTVVAVLALPSALPDVVSQLGWVLLLVGALAAGLAVPLVLPLLLPLLLSVGAAVGHLLVLLLALDLARVDVPSLSAVPLLLVVLVASSIPTSIAGWGPREGAAAWVFGAAGLGAAQGVTVTTVYAILSLVATLPGLVVLLADVLPRRIEVTAR